MGEVAVAASAPGKVLLAGGYLVLDRAYTGLTFALDARVHAIVQPIATAEGHRPSEVEVRSPQFEQARWKYGYRSMGQDAGMEVTQLSTGPDRDLSRNQFIETTLRYALSYVAAISSPAIPSASVTILADNDYYSGSPTQSDSSPRWSKYGVPLSKAHKTGLGSSAALVTALTAAVLMFYLPRGAFDPNQESHKRRLHNLAQAAHCAAQGKVGSGFDVASAVYGSCLYRRFSPAILGALPDAGSAGFMTGLRNLVEDNQSATWDVEIHREAVQLPVGLRLVICDVSGGSETPGMVKKVLAWRTENSERAHDVWSDLHKANQALANEMKLSTGEPWIGMVRYLARIRRLLRLMGEESGVPIEPPAQTKLLDACEGVVGVVGGVVPGAGGFDAIVLVIEDLPETVKELEMLFSDWDFMGESGATAKVQLLGVRQETNGVQREILEPYIRYLA